MYSMYIQLLNYLKNKFNTKSVTILDKKFTE